MFSKKEHYGTLRQCGFKTESHRVLWPKSGLLLWSGINKWGRCFCGTKAEVRPVSSKTFSPWKSWISSDPGQCVKFCALSPHFSKHSFKLVPELKFSALRLLSISHKMHCFFFLIISCHIISRQCKHQCHLMNCNGRSLVPGNNFLFSSIMQRLILEW